MNNYLDVRLNLLNDYSSKSCINTPRMALSYQKQIVLFCTLAIALQACTHRKKLYKSECDGEKTFKRITFSHLMDSLAFYDNKYVEVTGKYKQDKELSALLSENVFARRSQSKALWVEFSPDCPLYLEGTRIGFFDYDYNGGKLTPANNQIIVVHGIVNAHYKGHGGAYNGAIGHISYIQL
jgi:hypothetical protein